MADFRPTLDEADIEIIARDTRLVDESAISRRPSGDPVFKSQRALHILLVAIPLIAGLDKYANVIIYWPALLAPLFHEPLGLSAQEFMYAVGVTEISLGLGIAFRPRTGAFLFCAWMVFVGINVALSGHFYDHLFLNVGLATAAYVLGKLSHPILTQEWFSSSTAEVQ